MQKDLGCESKDVVEQPRIMRYVDAPNSPVVMLELVRLRESLHIRRWDNPGHLPVGVHHLYARPLDSKVAELEKALRNLQIAYTAQLIAAHEARSKNGDSMRSLAAVLESDPALKASRDILLQTGRV